MWRDAQMISPTLTVYLKEGANAKGYTVYGWYTPSLDHIEPIVRNPDGPGIGRWSLYHGEDPWSMH